MSRAVIIWGCGGHAREVALVCRQIRQPIGGFLDERPHMRGRHVDGIPVLGDLDDLPADLKEVTFFPGGVGDPELKRRFAERTRQAGLQLSGPIVHPSASLGDAELSLGVFVGSGAVMTVNVHVGEHVTVNRAVNLSHDVKVGAYATLSPAVQVSGNVEIGLGAYMGVASSVRERCRVGAGAMVGGGSFVAGDIADGAVVGGVPARPLPVRES